MDRLRPARPTNIDELELAFCHWAERRPDVDALIVVGSRAREHHPADEWSDLDIAVLARDAGHLRRGPAWISEIAEPLVVHRDPIGTALHVVFVGGLDAGIAVIPTAVVRAAHIATEVRSRVPLIRHLVPRPVHNRLAAARSEINAYCGPGMRILIDKHGNVGPLADKVITTPAPRPPMTETTFREVVNGFWFLGVWTAKHLRRGELWYSEAVGLAGLRRELMRLVEDGARRDRSVSVWTDGRYVEEWTDAQLHQELAATFARYDATDLRRAVVAIAGLFDRVAAPIAVAIDTTYPTESDLELRRWVMTTLGGVGESAP